MPGLVTSFGTLSLAAAAQIGSAHGPTAVENQILFAVSPNVELTHTLFFQGIARDGVADGRLTRAQDFHKDALAFSWGEFSWGRPESLPIDQGELFAGALGFADGKLVIGLTLPTAKALDENATFQEAFARQLHEHNLIAQDFHNVLLGGEVGESLLPAVQRFLGSLAAEGLLPAVQHSFETGPATRSLSVPFNGALVGFDEGGVFDAGLYAAAVPEPASLTLLGLAALATLTRRRA